MQEEEPQPEKQVQKLPPLEPRSPAVPEEFYIPDGALDNYFSQLALLENDPQEQQWLERWFGVILQLPMMESSKMYAIECKQDLAMQAQGFWRHK